MIRRLLLVTLIAGLVLPLAVTAADSTAWYSPDWKYRQKITVNHELVGGSVDGFPMLVRLTGKVFGRAQSDGNDILFTSADGTTKLLHEIESMDDEVAAWVQMPHLSEKEDTILYVYYGNPAAENQQRAANVWGNGYVGVWHLSQGPGDRQHDVTKNDNDGTPTNIDTQEGKAEGKIGPAINFDGSNDYIAIPDLASFDADYAFSAWAKSDATTDNQTVLGLNFAPFFEIWAGTFGSDTRYTWKAYAGTFNGPVHIESGVVPSGWTHLALTRSGSTNTLYVNGANTGTYSNTETFAANNPKIGARDDNTLNWDGIIDEVRISTTSRSGAWVKTEYNNQSGRENFLTIAEPETQSASTSTTSLLSSPMIQAINSLYRTAYDRGPTFAEWKLWADRVLAGEKSTFPELLGAMQWQNLFGN